MLGQRGLRAVTAIVIAVAALLVTTVTAGGAAADDREDERYHHPPSGDRPAFTLTIMHNNDGESSLLPLEVDGVEYGGVARFQTKVDELRRESGWRTYDRGEARRRGVVLLNSGDNFLAAQPHPMRT